MPRVLCNFSEFQTFYDFIIVKLPSPRQIVIKIFFFIIMYNHSLGKQRAIIIILKRRRIITFHANLTYNFIDMIFKCADISQGFASGYYIPADRLERRIMHARREEDTVHVDTMTTVAFQGKGRST